MDSKNVGSPYSAYLTRHTEIPATYYDRTCHIPIWKILEIYRTPLMQSDTNAIWGSRIFSGQVTSLTMLLRIKMKLTPELLRNTTIEKQLHYTIKQELEHTGNTTHIMKLSLFIDELGKLAEADAVQIYLDKSTRRPLTIPKWFREKYSDQKINPLIGKTPPLIPPQDCFKTTIKVDNSNTDVNGQFTSVHSFRCFMECATMAATSGFYRHFTSDMYWYPVAEVDAIFLGECFAGDEITVSTWQETEHFEKIYFTFSVHGKQIFQSSCVFDPVPYKEIISKL